MHISEFVIIGGAALAHGAHVPAQGALRSRRQVMGTLKGSPYNKQSYDELFKALYELLCSAAAAHGRA